jgi:tetratricopeptide (TPR) repeat protein
MPAPPGGPPPWVGLIDALCRFDTGRLAQPPADARFAPWAAVFRYLAAENPDAVQLSVVSAEQALKAAPDCARVREGLASLGNNAHRLRTTSESVTTFGLMLARRLGTLPGLPASAADLLKNSANEPTVTDALVTAGKPADAGEPTWAVPARLASAARVGQFATRLELLRDVIHQPLKDEWKVWRPVVADHPLVPYLDAYTLEPAKDGQKIAEALTIQYRDFRPVQGPLYRALAHAGPRQRQWAWQMVVATTDPTFGDWSALLALGGSFGRDLDPIEKLARASTYSPTARAAYIDSRWDKVESLAPTWEAETQNPIVLTALGRRYSLLRKWPDAERCLKKAIDNTPDASAFEVLADAYMEQDKKKESEATLEALLKRRDVDRDIARIGVAMGKKLLARGEPAKALPFAEAAAEAEAEKGADLAIECCEKLGDWKKAEAWARKTSELFPARVGLWFLWCHRTGRGDLEAATALLDKWQNRADAEPEVQDYEWSAARFLLADQLAGGAALIESAAKMSNSPRARLLAAVLFDAIGRTEERDRNLDAIKADDSMGKLAALFRETWTDPDAAGRLDNAAVERIIGTLPPDRMWLPMYAVARFHRTHGNLAKARSYLEQVANNRDETYPAALAAHDLRALDKKEGTKKDGK